MIRRFRTTILLGVMLSTAVAAQIGALRSPPSDIDAWVAKAMRTFDVPGVALAIVKDNDVVIAKGYGVRRLGESTAVDRNTLFGIASNTKMFTATALGLLVEEKKIEWDAPVIQYLPAFAMWDPYVTRELTVRDLLVHRSGLGLGAGGGRRRPTIGRRSRGGCGSSRRPRASAAPTRTTTCSTSSPAS